MLGINGSLTQAGAHGRIRQTPLPLLACRNARLFRQIFDKRRVDIVATKTRISVGCEHLKHTLVQFEYRDIKCPATQIVHCDTGAVLQSVEPVREGGGRGFVENSHHLQTRNFARLLCGVALRIVKIRGHGDHGLFHGTSQRALGVHFELPEHLRRNLLRRHHHVANPKADRVPGLAHDGVIKPAFLLPHAATDETLGGINSPLWSQGAHAHRRAPHQHFTLRGIVHHGRSQALARLIGDQSNKA